MAFARAATGLTHTFDLAARLVHVELVCVGVAACGNSTCLTESLAALQTPAPHTKYAKLPANTFINATRKYIELQVQSSRS